jgi:hypothetical protein
MFHRCILLFVVASLAVSVNSAWATSFFVDIANYNTSTDTNIYPTGVCPLSAGGGVVLQGGTGSSWTDPLYYSGGTSGTMSKTNSTFTYTNPYTSSSETLTGAFCQDMNESGDFCTAGFQTAPQAQWLTTNQGTNTTWSMFGAQGYSAGQYADRGLGIDSNDDICGTYNSSQAYAYINLRSGSTFTPYLLSQGSTAGTTAVAMTTPTTSGGVTTGYAVGWYNNAGVAVWDSACIWSYSISSGTIASTFTPLDAFTNGVHSTPLQQVYPSALASGCVAINSSGNALVVTTNINAHVTAALVDATAAFLYNVNNQTFTPVTDSNTGASLLLYDPMGAGLLSYGGHDQAINDAGDVVGFTGAQSDGSWLASMWVPNGSGGGTIENLNSVYGPSGLNILPANVVLNNALAIDDNGDISGVCTVGGSTIMQPFVIYNTLSGDANWDGKVDINDLTIVLAHYGQSGGWAQGEFTGDGTVDINDLTIVLANYGKTDGASTAAGLSAVPEPGSLLLLALAAVGLLAFARRVANKRQQP